MSTIPEPITPVLEPEAKDLAEQTDPHPRIYELPPGEGRKMLLDLQSGEGVERPDVDEEWVEVDAGQWGTVRTRIIRPKGVTGPLPVVFFIHGAGWVFGDEKTHDRMFRELVVEAILGLVDGCRELGVPVTGGNVSFYNQTGGQPIWPTPVIGMLGVIDDVAKRIGSGFRHEGDAVYLVGDTAADLSGSAWAYVLHDGHLGGMPPAVDFDHHRRLAEFMRALSDEEVVTSAHDLAEGGLAIALTESCLRRGLGVSLTLPDMDPTEALFSETAGRVLVSLHGDRRHRFETLAAEHGLPVIRLGEVIGTAAVEVVGQFTLDLEHVRGVWEAPIPHALQLD